MSPTVSLSIVTPKNFLKHLKFLIQYFFLGLSTTYYMEKKIVAGYGQVDLEWNAPYTYTYISQTKVNQETKRPLFLLLFSSFFHFLFPFWFLIPFSCCDLKHVNPLVVAVARSALSPIDSLTLPEFISQGFGSSLFSFFLSFSFFISVLLLGAMLTVKLSHTRANRNAATTVYPNARSPWQPASKPETTHQGATSAALSMVRAYVRSSWCWWGRIRIWRYLNRLE